MDSATIKAALDRIIKIQTPEQAQQASAERDRLARVAASNALKRSGCPAVTFEALSATHPTPALEKAQEFKARPRSEVFGLVLLGTTGIGKSVAAAYAARWCLYEFRLSEQPSGSAREWARWFTGAELGRLYTHDRDDRRDWEKLKTCGVLVLDDLGTEAADARVGEALWELVDARTGNRRPTIISANLKAAEFKARYGDRVADRLRPCSIVLEGSGASLRKAQP